MKRSIGAYQRMTEDRNTKTIAKNTLILYIRMFVMMLIGLYTSRVILNVLGVSDYGIYNVVGGLVGMFAIVSSSLSSSVSRFITFELGKGDVNRLKQIFSNSVIALAGMAFLVILIAESVGLWYLYNKMNLPPERLDAAAFVLQCSIVSFVFGILNTPFSAVIIAHERFGLYAYLTIFDAVMKLVVVGLLYFAPFDKLKTYAVLLLGVSLLVQIVYFVYSRRQFPECRFNWSFDKGLLKEMTGFAGWSFFGNTSWILNSQGIDLLVNFYFGVTLNAARGIANQVNNITQSFVTNFMTSLNPQITKSYANGDLEYTQKLVFAGAKYSYFLMLFISLPLLLETRPLLVLWLKIVPDYAVPFVQLTLVATMGFLLGNTLTTVQHATGHIKKFAIYTSLLTFMEFPIVFALFYMGFSVIWCYVIHFIIYFGLVFLKVYLVKDYLCINYMDFVKNVLIICLKVSLLSLLLPLLLLYYTAPYSFSVVIVCLSSVLSTMLALWITGLSKNEKKQLLNYISQHFVAKH